MPPPNSWGPPGRRYAKPSPVTAWACHPNPEAVRQRAIATARQRTGQPVTPPLDPVFVALNPQALPARPRPPAELHQWVRREEEYATLVTHPFRILPKACFLRIAWVACANDVAAWTVAAAPSRQLTAKAPSQ